MKKMLSPIVFFGSGPVAAESLALLAQDFTIEAVVTKPRPTHHHGDVPVLRVAKEIGIATYTVTNKKTLDELIASSPFKSSLAILIDFGIIISQTTIDYFQFGIVNSHFSLLPEWRGADPISFSILSGQPETGVSLMLLTAGMDEGPLLAQAPYIIPRDTTTPTLTAALIEISAASLGHIVPLYIAGEIEAAPQETVSISPIKMPTYSRKLSKEDSNIDWHKPAQQIEREIRAFIEWPKSRTTIGELDIVITKARVIPLKGQSGTISIYEKELVIYCGKDALVIEMLKPAGKKEMAGRAFLAGYKKLLI